MVHGEVVDAERVVRTGWVGLIDWVVKPELRVPIV